MQGGPEGERRAGSRDDHVTVSCHDWRPTWPLSPPVASRKSINIADPKAWLPELVERAAGGEESHLANRHCAKTRSARCGIRSTLGDYSGVI